MLEEVKKVLNVGAGESNYGTHFIDLYPASGRVMKCNVDEDKFPFRDNYFDEIYAECIFEHLKNPSHFLKESHRVPKKNGRIVIITDNAGLFGWQGKIHHGKYEENRSAKGMENDRHFALFTAHHLNNWLTSSGFKNPKIEHFINKQDELSFRYKIFLKAITSVSKRFSPNLKATATK